MEQRKMSPNPSPSQFAPAAARCWWERLEFLRQSKKTQQERNNLRSRKDRSSSSSSGSVKFLVKSNNRFFPYNFTSKNIHFRLSVIEIFSFKVFKVMSSCISLLLQFFQNFISAFILELAFFLLVLLSKLLKMCENGKMNRLCSCVL